MHAFCSSEFRNIVFPCRSIQRELSLTSAEEQCVNSSSKNLPRIYAHLYTAGTADPAGSERPWPNCLQWPGAQEREGEVGLH